MARDFSTRNDIDKTELAKYPNGRIKEGIAEGTLWDEAVTGDFYQVFLKAMREAGITPNGLPDNQTNGWQMFDACFGTAWKEVGNDGGLTTFTNGAASSSGPLSPGNKIRYRKINGGKCLQIDGWYVPTTLDYTTAFTLPVGYRPSGFTMFTSITNDGSILHSDIRADGTVSSNAGGAGSIFLSVVIPLD
jgi:hypothetical protein